MNASDVLSTPVDPRAEMIPAIQVPASNGYTDILNRKIAEGTRAAAGVIERIHTEAPKDQIVRLAAVKFTAEADGLGIGVGDDAYRPSRYALDQIAERVSVPSKYLRALVGTLSPGEQGDPESDVVVDAWQRELAAHTLTQHYSHEAGRGLVRSVKGQLRGWLSDRYRRLDSRPLVDTLVQESDKVGAIPMDGCATETRVALKVVIPRVMEPVPGEYLVYGVEWSNSDYGNGTNSIRAFALRVACLNGMTRENLLREIHLGGRLNEELGFSDRTYRLDTAASVSAVRDVVKGALGPVGMQSLTDKIQAAAAKPYSAKELARAVRNVPKATGQKIVEAYESQDVVNLPPGETAWRASNAVSWIARHAKDAEARLDLERLAGTLA